MTPKTRFRVRRSLDWAKFVLVGALAGLAFVNTYGLIIGIDPSQPAETIGMLSGATIMTALIKALHVL